MLKSESARIVLVVLAALTIVLPEARACDRPKCQLFRSRHHPPANAESERSGSPMMHSMTLQVEQETSQMPTSPEWRLQSRSAESIRRRAVPPECLSPYRRLAGSLI